MIPPFRLTPRAREDLRGIGRYTQATWGKAQRDCSLAAPDRRFRWLAEAPERGRPRPDVGEGLRCFPEGAHLVFYAIRAGGIDIIGVPHQAMDVPAHVLPPVPEPKDRP
jgi:toxin ParE1/3/4